MLIRHDHIDLNHVPRLMGTLDSSIRWNEVKTLMNSIVIIRVLNLNQHASLSRLDC